MRGVAAARAKDIEEARAELLTEEKAHIQTRQIFHLDNFQASSFEMVVESFSLILLPIWLTHYSVNDKRYEVLINVN